MLPRIAYLVFAVTASLDAAASERPPCRGLDILRERAAAIRATDLTDTPALLTALDAAALSAGYQWGPATHAAKETALAAYRVIGAAS